jgi:glycosyltransferase involved in cell wall biosynthesis
VSLEKNMTLLVDVFRALIRKRPGIGLVVAGDGPFLETMKRELAGTAVEFTGLRDDSQLNALYNSSDLFVFPSRTDTLGQAVMEAQACGLPAIVSNEGGPKESVEHNVTGLVLSGNDPAAWCRAIEELLDDEPRCQNMSHAAAARMAGCSIQRSFESFWNDHLAIVEPPADTLESPLAAHPRSKAHAGL